MKYLQMCKLKSVTYLVYDKLKSRDGSVSKNSHNIQKFGNVHNFRKTMRIQHVRKIWIKYFDWKLVLLFSLPPSIPTCKCPNYDYTVRRTSQLITPELCRHLSTIAHYFVAYYLRDTLIPKQSIFVAWFFFIFPGNIFYRNHIPQYTGYIIHATSRERKYINHP